MALTAEQETLLNALEEEFKNRYTEEDPEYKRVLECEEKPPPIVEKWKTGDGRGGRNFRNHSRGGNYNRRYHGGGDRYTRGEEYCGHGAVSNDRRNDYDPRRDRSYPSYASFHSTR